uniref:Uncharacterized protein n=1 Tax=Nelumbo nucifera TaxID=4432 RepID=A0A822ZF65_NELNU|nr:TPA_asm: hypothetical protein HUJ06_001992 [Nelumbo nucifera]
MTATGEGLPPSLSLFVPFVLSLPPIPYHPHFTTVVVVSCSSSALRHAHLHLSMIVKKQGWEGERTTSREVRRNGGDETGARGKERMKGMGRVREPLVKRFVIATTRSNDGDEEATDGRFNAMNRSSLISKPS